MENNFDKNRNDAYEILAHCRTFNNLCNRSDFLSLKIIFKFSFGSRITLNTKILKSKSKKDDMKQKILLLGTCLSSFFFCNAQMFTNLESGFPTLGEASFAWRDYDNDGDSDVIIIGFSGQVAEVSLLYRNEGSGVFTLLNSNIVKVASGSVNWGDYDNDGDPDLLINGMKNGTAITHIYRNDGGDLFTDQVIALPGLIGIARWIDYDNDGWLDVVMAGSMGSQLGDSMKLFHNDGAGVFTELPEIFPNCAASDIAVADFDNDGDQDFFLTGYTSSVPDAFCRLYENDGNGNFSAVPQSFYNLSTGTAAWGDYDNDGDLDLLYDGIDSTASFPFTFLYRNDGSGVFTLTNDSLPGSGEPGSVDFGDVNEDGLLDILLSGTNSINGTYLLRNDGNDTFTDITPSWFLPSVPSGFIDMDVDGDLDILVIQQIGGFTASTLIRNDLIGLSTSSNNLQGSFSFFPVPASDQVTIKYRSSAKNWSVLKVYDAEGNICIIQTLQLAEGENSIPVNCSSMKPGIYIAKFFSATEVAEKKLVIE